VSEALDKMVNDLARSQHGLVSAAQLSSLGFSKHRVHRHLRTRTWSTLSKGLYKVGAAPLTIEALQFGALLAAPDGAALSHLSAAVKWRIDAPPASRIQVTIPFGKSYRPMRGVEVFISRDLPAEDVVRFGQLRLTSLARTVIDLAAIVTEDELEGIVDAAARRAPAHVLAIHQMLERLGRGHRGATRLRKLLGPDGSGSVPASKLESMARTIVREVNLGQPVRHYLEHDLGFSAELDLAWEDELVDFELDGYRWHTSRHAFARDRERDNHLQWMGWRVIRATWQEVKYERARVVADLRKHLLQRRANPPRFTSQAPRCPPP
jgi:very-short-patch-repair endonuclease